MAVSHIMSWDPGKKADWSALGVVDPYRRITQTTIPEQPTWSRPTERADINHFYRLSWLERFAMGTPYPRQVERVKAIFHNPKMANSILLIDCTGVGEAALDWVREPPNAIRRAVGIIFHSGRTITEDDEHGIFSVPKRYVATRSQAVIQSQRFSIPAKLARSPLGQTLKREMLNFQIKVDDKTGADQYAVWRHGEHDDLILMLLQALWWAEMRTKARETELLGDDDRSERKAYDPLHYRIKKRKPPAGPTRDSFRRP